MHNNVESKLVELCVTMGYVVVNLVIVALLLLTVDQDARANATKSNFLVCFSLKAIIIKNKVISMWLCD